MTADRQRRFAVTPPIATHTSPVLDAAIDVLLKTTVDTIRGGVHRDDRSTHVALESFYRMVTHELRQPLGTLQFGLRMLSTDERWSSREKRDRLFATCERNVTKMGETLGKLVLVNLIFYRGHASRDGELGNSGLGLGLSIVHDCIGALKGDVHVESEHGTGTTFLIELPFAPPL